MSAPGQVLFSRSILRGYVAEVRKRGLLDAVRARSSAELLPLLEDPRSAPAWVPSALLVEILVAMEALRGRAAVRDFGYQTMHAGGLAQVLEPMIQLSLRLLGGQPDALFSRAHLMASVIAHGVEITWRATDVRSGVVTVRYAEPAPAIAWAPWEGAFAFAIDLTGATGTVGEARCEPVGTSCQIDVSWVPK